MPQDSVSAFAYPLVYQANHMFVELPEGKFLVDTGAPHTFGRTGSVTYGARRVAIPSATLGANVDSLEKLPGVRCDGLLGMDLMSTAQVLWDGPSGKAIVGETVVAAGARRVPYRSLMGVPVVDASIGGRKLSCIYDTGAQYGYVLRREFAECGEDDGAIEDYNPIMGKIHSPAWRVPVDMHGVQFQERVGVLTGMFAGMLGMVGVDAIVGCSWMPSRRVWFMPEQASFAVA